MSAAVRRRGALRSLAAPFAIAAAAALLIAAILLLTEERSSYERETAVSEAQRDNALLAQVLAARVASGLRAADAALQSLAREAGRDPQASGRDARTAAALAEALLGSGAYDALAVVDAEGRVTMRAGRLAPLDLAGSELLARHRADPGGAMQVGAPAFGLSGGAATILLSRAVTRPDGAFSGVALLAVTPDYFAGFAPEPDARGGHQLLVAGLDGRVRARFGNGAAASADAGDDAGASALLAAARRAPAGSLVNAGPDNGVSRYVSFRVLGAYPLVAAAASDVEGALAPFRVRHAGFVRGAWLATVAVVLLAATLIAAWVMLDRGSEQFRQLARHIPEAFWMTDARGARATYLSPAFREVSGLPPLPLAEAWSAWLGLVPAAERDRVRAFYADGGREATELEHRIVRPDGARRWVRARAFPMADATGERYALAGTLEDVTERHLAEERLQHDAQFDAVTDLPNRLLCGDRLGQALVQARRRHTGAAVLYVDIDRFKTVNDMLGHAVGDLVLRSAGERLARSVRAGDTVARIGGDEFAVVLAELAHPRDAAAVAQKAIDAMAPPMLIEGHEVFVTASVGIAVYPADGADGDALMRNADAAMFKAKQAGRANFQFYTAEMNAHAMEKLLLENDLRLALERDEFQLYYQPKQHLQSGRIVGLEALLRWVHPRHGVMSPGEFVPLLEDSGLIVKVGDWVVRAACRQVRAWQEAGVKPVPVAVNLAARQFLHHDLLGVIERALEVGIDPSLLSLEITESDAMRRPEEVITMLQRLRKRGITVAIDDFGTGYSSLSYVKRMPIDALKLDRSFVTDLPQDEDDASIARAVIAMAHSLGMRVIAEGVETPAQRDFLLEHGCDQIQGYLVSAPLTADDCAALLRRAA